MPAIRVLTVDDAVVVRRMLFDALSAEPDIEIVGAAANGRIALQAIPQCHPDVVTLDLEMPDLNGLDTVRLIRQSWPDLPVIMFSAATERGASATFDALAAGATDYLPKPTRSANPTAGLASIRAQLAPRIRALASRRPHLPARTFEAPAQAGLVPIRRRPRPIRAVAIGASTGGPNALASVLPALSPDLDVPIFVVQHMPPIFTRHLAERLARQCALGVVEARHGESVQAGHIYVAQGGFHMRLRARSHDVMIELDETPPENSCRPAVDVLFRSAAAVYGAGTLGVVLTGMGRDGLAGARHIRDAGGDIVTQDEATSVVWGMPGFVTRAGLASLVCPLDAVALQIDRAVHAGRVRQTEAGR